MPSLKDIALYTGYSPSTISRVVNNKTVVNEKTRKKIMEAVNELGYKPNLLAQGLRGKKGNLIGLVVPNDTTHSFDVITHSTIEIARKKGYEVILGSGNDDPKIEADFIDNLVRRNINGIIMSRVSDQSSIMPKLIKKKIPIVVVDRTLENESVTKIILDNMKAGRLAAEYLLSLGHEKFACISGPFNITLGRERLQGFRDVLKENGLTLNDENIYEGDFKFKSGISGVKELIQKNRDFTAIWALNDLMAFGALKELNRHNIKVPSEVSVMGMDNMDFCEMIIPSLTTIHYPFKQMAELAVDLIVRMAENNMVETQTVILQPSVVVRESTKKI